MITGAVLIGCTTLAAGCGGGSPSSTHASASTPRGPGQAAYAFARCMRTHGVSDFPDPQVVTSSGGGSVKQAVPAGAAASPAFKTAQKACQRFQPAPGSDGVPGNQEQRTQTLVSFARCLRAHGLTGFPDPNGQGQLTLAMINAAGVDVHGPAFVTAAKACVGVTHGAITLAQVAAAASGNH